MKRELMGQVVPVTSAIAFGGLGGFLAKWLGFPMPFLLGSFGVSMALALSRFQVFGTSPALPMGIRNIFVAVIGVMIGGAFTPGLWGEVRELWLPALAIIGFVLLALASNYLIFRKLGRFDPVTAYYAAMPGGLIESIALGEKAGGDVEKLSIQQFLRIAFVITLVPTILQFWTGTPVGSAAGVRLEVVDAEIALTDYAILFLCGLIGLYGGNFIRLPAAILTGPLILSGIAHGTGLTEASLPEFVINLAQVIVGAGLGFRFKAFGVVQLLRSTALAIASVFSMLIYGALIALLLTRLTDLPFTVLFIAFAPGGVTETALIALSLSASPVIVTTLHVFRIGVAVGLIAIGTKLVRQQGHANDDPA